MTHQKEFPTPEHTTRFSQHLRKIADTDTDMFGESIGDTDINTNTNTNTFLPARRYASAGLCDSDVSVCLSVRPSVTRRYCA